MPKRITVFLILLNLLLVSPFDAMAKKKPEKEKVERWLGLEAYEFPYFTMEPKVGYIFYGEIDYGEISMPARHAAMISYGFSIGGDGYSFELDPIFAIEQSTKSKYGRMYFVGGFTGMILRFGKYTGNRVVPFIGVGIKGGYLFADKLDEVMELYGRFPVGLDFYIQRGFGLFLEVGLMWGATGIRAKNEHEQWRNLNLGSGFAIDTQLGVRFP